MTDISRRTALRLGAALAVVPWVTPVVAAPSAEERFSTGSAKVDAAIGGGVRAGSLVVVIDSGQSSNASLARMAQANGVSQIHSMNAAGGAADMLSLMRARDGRRTGCLLLNSPEPSTGKEQADMQRDPAARDAFLSRWFDRARHVVHESGGIMAIRVRAAISENAPWISIPDYVVTADERVIK